MSKMTARAVSYVSTRGMGEGIGFEDALIGGLARDGGLLVPDVWPLIGMDAIRDMQGSSYEDIARKVLAPFVRPTFDEGELHDLIVDAYRGFGHEERCPLVRVDDTLWILELHHGPTLAFKDFALALVARMFNAVLHRKGRKVAILGATSGDTGSAAIEAFRGLDAVKVFILYPHGRVSDIQRRQMTTPVEDNVFALAVEGDFDHCQAIVKGLFNDLEYRDRLWLAAVNSINWARIVAQMAYYYSAAVRLGSPGREVGFVVPTGNFGDIYAGYAARKTGLPIRALHVATNQNDILYRALNCGEYRPDRVRQSISPSMDIQVSSNFERALFDACGRDGSVVRGIMDQLAGGGFSLAGSQLAYLKGEFAASRCSEAETMAEIGETWRQTGMMLCPHSAVGMRVARKVASKADYPVVALATAHAAKFPEAVEEACGQKPDLPAGLRHVLARDERERPLMAGIGDVRDFMERETGH